MLESTVWGQLHLKIFERLEAAATLSALPKPQQSSAHWIQEHACKFWTYSDIQHWLCHMETERQHKETPSC